MKTYLREWITAGYHCASTSLNIVEFKSDKELSQDKKLLKDGHNTISIRYFELKEIGKVKENLK